MRELKDLLKSQGDQPRRTRVSKEDESTDRNKYSTIFHYITTELKLDTSAKITVFANIEGLSRKHHVCVMNSKKLATLSGCTELELSETLRRFAERDLIEEAQDSLKRHGWRLTEKVRLLVEPIRDELGRNRAKKYASKGHN